MDLPTANSPVTEKKGGSNVTIIGPNGNTGRWTTEEQSAFECALQTHGKNWKKVSERIPTRTLMQIRTHAQKYFKKRERDMKRQGCGPPDALGQNFRRMSLEVGTGKNNLSNSVVSQSPKQKTASAKRQGRWTKAEEAYANQLIEEFNAGTLQMEDGCMLRIFLAKALNCEPMR